MTAVSANLALVKAVSFPVFGAVKSGRKESSDQSSSAASSASASRGWGRGSSSDQNRKGYPSSPVSSGAQSRFEGEGFSQVGVMPLSNSCTQLPVLQMVGLEGHGCGCMGGRSFAGEVCGSVPHCCSSFADSCHSAFLLSPVQLSISPL